MSIVAILLLLAVAWSVLSKGSIPNPFRARTCQGRLWRRAFPAASKKQIREFLSLFTDAFAFRDIDQLKFRPDDQLLGIYRALHPSKWMADALELEILSAELRARYGVAPDTWDERMTLGALFAYIQSRPPRAAK
ncbi:hypothetical protein G4G28_22840 [Massilia sp. Dwa41.01b]|uniref:hypothetical protein n=1 Tax=unclassified Massilia TaxID=2609279 RepID=UPI0015FEF158|nr:MULTISPECIES: hypothetical protein [unclassified Massilia]QNA90637.1 hypothetical protein G4G28_22840 [Massilia sp. Dwa41.01b]QNA97867.1 hypothetical protein G4G31_01910 [Massilia sp. Se16.2.3]